MTWRGTRYWTKVVRPYILARDNFTCKVKIPGICKGFSSKLPADKLEVDHIVPVARGGSDSFNNLRAACKSCNRHLAANMVNQPKVGPSRDW